MSVLDISYLVRSFKNKNWNISLQKNVSWLMYFTGENWQFLRREVFIRTELARIGLFIVYFEPIRVGNTERV